MMRRTVGLTAAGVAAALALGAGVGYVASRPDPTPPAASAAQTASGSSAGMMTGGPMGSFSSTQPFDLQFIDQMTMHHQGAIVSARNMIADSPRPDMRALANAIITDQTAQVRQMQAWRQQWYPQAANTFSGMMGTGMMGSGMMGNGMRGMMGGQSGQLDAMFLGMMIPHYQLAIDMAQQALSRAEHPALKDLARTIITGQSSQIRQMQTYLAAMS